MNGYRERGDFHYSYRIPHSARSQWPHLWPEWSEKDKSWDLSRFYRWVEREHPEYLSQEIAFIGYVQVLVEWPGYSLEKLSIQRVKVFLCWGLGGAQGTRLSEDGKPVENPKGQRLPRWDFRLQNEPPEKDATAPRR
ncbi:MAG: hypothetical protein FJ279_38785 [Planctomycetes bacterium]|nr:hypothetical protein [Planctomycetota bacterium]